MTSNTMVIFQWWAFITKSIIGEIRLVFSVHAMQMFITPSRKNQKAKKSGKEDLIKYKAKHVWDKCTFKGLYQ